MAQYPNNFHMLNTYGDTIIELEENFAQAFMLGNLSEFQEQVQQWSCALFLIVSPFAFFPKHSALNAAFFSGLTHFIGKPCEHQCI